MEYLVMECGLSYAVVMDAEGRFLKVPNLGYTVGQRLDEVLLLPERPAVKMSLSKQIIRWGAMAACLCLLMLGGWFWQSPIGTVRIKINPDVQLKINRFDAVVAAQGLERGWCSSAPGLPLLWKRDGDRSGRIGRPRRRDGIPSDGRQSHPDRRLKPRRMAGIS